MDPRNKIELAETDTGCSFCRRPLLRLFKITRRESYGAALLAFICDGCIADLVFVDKVQAEHAAREGA